MNAVLPFHGRPPRFDEGVAGQTETLRLPLSGLRFQRLADGRWRCVTPAQYDDEQAGHFVPGPGEWVRAELPVGVGGRAERAPGRPGGASWWVIYGDARKGSVTVTLADGQTPAILTFGPLWICEWLSPWQAARVTVGDESFHVFGGPVQNLVGDDVDS